MEYCLQPFIVNNGFRIVKNDFTTYNPETDFTEDLLQIELDAQNLVIDLGWYGEVIENEGEFTVFVIENNDWENPIKVETSKSQITITQKLNYIIENINTIRSK